MLDKSCDPHKLNTSADDKKKKNLIKKKKKLGKKMHATLVFRFVTSFET